MADARVLVPTPRQHAAGDTSALASPGNAAAPAPTPVPGPAPARPARARFTGPRLPLVAFGLVALFAGVDQSALGVLLPDIRAEFGLSLRFLTTLSAALGILALSLALPLGYLADRTKRVHLVRSAAIGTGAAAAVQGLAPGVGAFAGGRALATLAPELAKPAAFPLLADYYPPAARGRAFAAYYAAGQAGVIAGPILAGVLGDHFGWRTALVALGIAGTFAGLVAFAVREPRRGAGDGATEVPEPAGLAESWRVARNVTTLRRLWYATPLVAPFGLVTVTILPVYFGEAFLLPASTRGLIAALAAAAGLLGLVAAGPLADRLLQDRPARLAGFGAAAAVAQALLLAVLAVVPGVVAATLVWMAFAFLATVQTPMFFAVVSMVVPARIRGFGLQTLAPWQIVGLVFAGVIATQVASTGLPQGLLWFVPLQLVAAVVIGSAGPGIDRDIAAALTASSAARDAAALHAAESALLVVRGVEVAYDGVPVLMGVDFDVAAGEIVALLGTNGAGKSTLLRAIAGVRAAGRGAVFFDGHDITHATPAATSGRGVTLMPGGDAVFGDLTVEENLQTVLAARGVERSQWPARIAEVWRIFPRLAERAEVRAGALSGGEQQMVGLGQAVLAQPRLLLVDEVSLGLSPALVGEVLDVLRALAADGTAVIVVEQSVNVALTIARRALVLERGRIAFDGGVEELLDDPTRLRAVVLGGISAGPRTTRVTPSRLPAMAARRAPVEDSDAPRLAVRDLTVRFGGVEAVRSVNLDVAAGTVTGVIGPNGAGKTTFFDAIGGFVPVASGAVALDGVDLARRPRHERARLGLVRSFQTARLFPALTVRECVALAIDRSAAANPMLDALHAGGAGRVERRIAVRAAGVIEMMGLGRYADTPVGALSTGVRRAVDLACTMSREPRVVLLDEPSSGLAQSEVEEIGPLVHRLVRSTGTAVLLVEHDIPLVAGVASRLVVFDLGAVIADGPPASVLEDPVVVAAYLDAPADVIARSGPRAAVLQAGR